MSITIAIEELVIDGIPLSASERPLLAHAVQRELTRRYTREGGAHLGAGQCRDHLVAQEIAYTSPVSANALGYAIAQAVYGALQR